MKKSQVKKNIHKHLDELTEGLGVSFAMLNRAGRRGTRAKNQGHHAPQAPMSPNALQENKSVINEMIIDVDDPIGKVSEIIPDIEKVTHSYIFLIGDIKSEKSYPQYSEFKIDSAKGDNMFNDLLSHKNIKEFLKKYIKDFFGESAENLNDYIDSEKFYGYGKKMEDFKIYKNYEIMFKDGGIMHLDFKAFDSSKNLIGYSEELKNIYYERSTEMIKRYYPIFACKKWDMSIDEIQKAV